MSDALEDAAAIVERAAQELEQAAAHCRTAAGHFRDRNVPRAAAHAWAAHGHALRAQEELESQAKEHAAKSIA